MVQIQTMTNYDNKKSKIFISLNVLLKEIWNMMICAFSLSRRSYLCFKPICHKLLSQLTRIDWCLTLQIALQADQFPRRAQSLVPNFPLKVAHPNSRLFIFSNFFYIKNKIYLFIIYKLLTLNVQHTLYQKNLYAIRQRI